MQNTDEVIQQGLAFLQTGMGLAMLLLVALMLVMCVLLTVLVVSMGTTQRALIAHADSANRALLKIRESLASTENPLPNRRKPVIKEPNLPLRRVAGGPETPKSRESIKPAVRPTRSARSDARADAHASTEAKDPRMQAGRSARSDGRTDVYANADVKDAAIQPARRTAHADSRAGTHKRTDTDPGPKSGSGASTDVFKSVDI